MNAQTFDQDRISFDTELCQEHQWIGPMPSEEFLSEFCPQPAEAYTGQTDIFANIGDNTSCEYDISKNFMDAVNSHNLVAPHFQVVGGREGTDCNSSTNLRPDGAGYPIGVDVSRPTQFDVMAWIRESKFGRQYTPFIDPPNTKAPNYEPPADCTTFLTTTKDGISTRGQLVSYATEAMSRQHRTHIFVVFLAKEYARILRFDRAATVVSRAIYYKEDSHYLVRFLWNFARMDGGRQGYDDTVSRPTTAEMEEARKALMPYVRKFKYKRDIFKIRVPDRNGEHREVFAWKPYAEGASIHGRGTKGWPVYEKSTKRVLFLKDSWRDVELPREYDILRELNEAGVRYVPTLECGGELEGQVTTHHNYVNRPWRCREDVGEICVRQHQRFLSREVGRPLETFHCAKSLLEHSRQAILGHQDAYTKLQYLHRDISAGNIMIVEKNGALEGMLNDWDLAKKESEADNGPRQLDRTGTWQFLSIARLQKPQERHLLEDDLESFFWVILYHGLRYLASSFSDEALSETMGRIFDSIDLLSAKGGYEKKRALKKVEDVIPHDFTFINNPAFHSWFVQVREHLRQYVCFDELVEALQAISVVIPERVPLNYEVFLHFWESALARPDSDWNPAGPVDRTPDAGKSAATKSRALKRKSPATGGTTSRSKRSKPAKSTLRESVTQPDPIVE